MAGSQPDGRDGQATAEAPPPATGGARLHGGALAGVLAALMLTMLLAALDQTIVSTALPKIIDELHGYSLYTWVVTSYLLAETAVIPIVGKLSDQFGRKWFVIVGVVIFLIGSMLSGASQTMIQLVLFRGVQGIGAGFLFALIFTLIGDIFVPAERARWQGLFSGVFALASVIGPTLGGWITDTTSWRWVFYVNVPLGIVALVLLYFWLPANISLRSSRYSGRDALRRIDVFGAITAVGGTVCLLLGLNWGGQTYPWNSTVVIGILVASGAFFVAFFIAERRAAEPILPLDLFKNQVFATGALLSLTVGMAFFAVVIYLPLFIQAVLGQSATSSGAAITPLTLALAAGAAIVGQIVAKVGRYQVVSIIGAVIMAFGIYLMTGLNAASGLGTVTLYMIVVGVGLGTLQPVLTLAVQNAIPRTRLGVGTSAVTYLRTTGQTLGVAVIGSVVNTTVANELPRHLPAQAHQLPPAVLSAATNEQLLTDPRLQQALVQQVVHAATQHVPPALVAQVTAQVEALLHQIFEATRQALAVGIHNAFVASLFISLAVIVITFFLKDVPLTPRVGPPAPAEASTAPEEPSGHVPALSGTAARDGTIRDGASRDGSRPTVAFSHDDSPTAGDLRSTAPVADSEGADGTA
jgi:EmrB/QacA subfamily drug resistance transporter